jgi:dipeptidase D
VKKPGMSLLSQLNPASIWIYFQEICTIPRLSKNEGKIKNYLIDFAIKNNLEHKEDLAGNILITRAASKGFENRKTIVLQSHMDMVGEKNADYSHNWDTDPIIPFIRDGWVCAKGTTLGADDGIGIASQMAVLTEKSILTGKIECLFTVDEESGMTGAINLKPDFFTGNTLLNLDSEDEGIFYIGCAGGMDTIGTIKYNPIAVDQDMLAYNISLTGLHGGHSGDEIHRGYGNSVKIMNRFLILLSEELGISISSFNGGNLRNAIPREAFATVTISKNSLPGLQKSVKSFLNQLGNEYGRIEPDLKMVINPSDLPPSVMDKGNQSKLFKSIEDCPHGVIAWSNEMDDLVETSTNLASIKFIDNNRILIVTTQRSSIESSKREVAEMVGACLKIAGADVVHSDGYPGWKPNISSDILKIARTSYKRLFRNEPKIRAIHAGLECGLIYENNKSIDMISFGPSIKGAHTPEEMINIESTRRFWDLLLDVIQNIPEKE